MRARAAGCSGFPRFGTAVAVFGGWVLLPTAIPEPLLGQDAVGNIEKKKASSPLL